MAYVSIWIHLLLLRVPEFCWMSTIIAQCSVHCCFHPNIRLRPYCIPYHACFSLVLAPFHQIHQISIDFLRLFLYSRILLVLDGQEGREDYQTSQRFIVITIVIILIKSVWQLLAFIHIQKVMFYFLNLVCIAFSILFERNFAGFNLSAWSQALVLLHPIYFNVVKTYAWVEFKKISALFNRIFILIRSIQNDSDTMLDIVVEKIKIFQ